MSGMFFNSLIYMTYVVLNWINLALDSLLSSLYLYYKSIAIHFHIQNFFSSILQPLKYISVCIVYHILLYVVNMYDSPQI